MHAEADDRNTVECACRDRGGCRKAWRRGHARKAEIRAGRTICTRRCGSRGLLPEFEAFRFLSAFATTARKISSRLCSWLLLALLAARKFGECSLANKTPFSYDPDALCHPLCDFENVGSQDDSAAIGYAGQQDVFDKPRRTGVQSG